MDFKYGGNVFYMDDENGKRIAEITFYNEGDKLAIDHTYVDPILRGKGIAEKLLNLVVEKARKENKKIIPICSYAVTMLKKDIYSDVI